MPESKLLTISIPDKAAEHHADGHDHHAAADHSHGT